VLNERREEFDFGVDPLGLCLYLTSFEGEEDMMFLLICQFFKRERSL